MHGKREIIPAYGVKENILWRSGSLFLVWFLEDMQRVH